MSILWAGGEDSDFSVGGNLLFQRAIADDFRPAYSRHAICRNGYSNALDAVPTWTSPVTAGLTSCWLRYVLCFRWAGGTSDISNGITAGTGNAAANAAGIYLGIYRGDLRILKWQNNTATTLATLGSVFAGATIYLLPIDLEIADYGETGTVNVYINSAESPSLTYSGDLRVSGVDALDCVGICGAGFASTNTVYRHHLSEMALSTTDTRAIVGIKHRTAIAAGDSNDMTGDHTAINTATNNDLTALYSNTNGDAAQFALTTMPDGDYRVAARCVSVRAVRSTDATVTTMKLGEKITGGASNLGDAISVDAGVFKTYQRVVEAYQSKTDAGNMQVALQVLT